MIDIMRSTPYILHVDDESDFLELFTITFKNHFKIVSVQNSWEVIEKIRKEKVDAIVTDYEMPQLNGLELLKIVKDQYPDIPVILQTGQGNEEVAREAFILGASDYFTKDFFSFAHKEKFLNSILKAIEIKRVAEEKRKAEEIIRNLSKFPSENPNPVMRISIDGRIIYGNNASNCLLKLWNCNINSMVPPHIRNIVNEVNITGEPLTQEVLCQNRLYSLLYVPVMNHPYVNIYGGNITEFKKTKQALTYSEERYRELADLLPQTVFEIDNVGNITYSNRFGFEFTGYSMEEVYSGINISRIIAQEDHNRIKDNLEQILKGGNLEGHEYTLLKKDGTKCPVVIYTRPITRNGLNVGFRGILVDITPQKNMETKLREQRNRAQKYLDLAGVIIMALDTEGNITLINKKGAEVLGLDEKLIIGKNWFHNFIPARIRENIFNVYKKLMAGEIENVEHFENSIITAKGKEKTIAWTNTLLKNEENEITGTLSSGEDITERKK